MDYRPNTDPGILVCRSRPKKPRPRTARAISGLKAFKELADIMLNLTKVNLENILENGTIIEVICDD